MTNPESFNAPSFSSHSSRSFNTNPDDDSESLYPNSSSQLTVYERWDEYNLKPELLDGIFAIGFEQPSFIQKTAVMPIITKRDIRAQAQSGTGKTAAFGVGALQRLSNEKVTQILILVTTREMAEQNAARISSLASKMSVNICVLAGGKNVKETADELSAKPEIVVGTPGRVLHMIADNYLDTSNITLMIIDEADEMLSRGFSEQLNNIFGYLPEKMQVAMFSATWEENEMAIASRILRDPVVIDLRTDEQTLKGIEQYYVNLGDRTGKNSDHTKLGAFIDIYRNNNLGQCVVFVSSRNKANYVHSALVKQQIPCAVIHGDIEKDQRTNVLESFRKGESRLLIATGLVGRGIDIQQLSLVVNFDLPRFNSSEDGGKKTDKSNYLHRIGRAGRFGRKGKALNLIFNDEMEVIQEIMDHYRTSIVPLPNDFDLS